MWGRNLELSGNRTEIVEKVLEKNNTQNPLTSDGKYYKEDETQ
jgi:hypothetical protein